MELTDKIEEFEMKMYGSHYDPAEDIVEQTNYGSYVKIGDDNWNMEVIELLYGKNYDPKKVFHWYDVAQEIINFYNQEYERLLIERVKKDIKKLLA